MEGVCTSCGANAELDEAQKCPGCAGGEAAAPAAEAPAEGGEMPAAEPAPEAAPAPEGEGGM